MITRICAPGKVFIDVGAHIGSIISDTQKHVPSARIVAFEAIPDKVRDLRRSFPHAEIHECAVGDSEGEVAFFVHATQSGYSSLTASAGQNSKSVSKISVKMKRLDDVVTSADVDTIKIDVEGAELRVLKGGRTLIENARPIIMFESGALANGETTNQTGLWQFFADINYIILVPNRLAHVDPGMGLEVFLEGHLYPRRTTNFFAVPAERASEFRDRARRILSVSVT